MQQNDSEEWLDIPGYEGLYLISNMGRIKSLPRPRAKERILRMRQHNAGYIAVDLCNGGVYQSFLVHRLVLEAFFGPCPEGREACHNDGNKKNNKLENLRWDTRSSNLRDRLRLGESRKLTKELVSEIRKRLGAGESQQSIANSVGVCQNMISNIKLGRMWKGF